MTEAKPKKKQRRISPETKAALRRDRAAGATLAEISSHYNMPYSTVYNICAGVTYAKGGSAEQESVRLPLGEIRDLAARGWSARRIAEWLGCATATISENLARNVGTRLCSATGCESTAPEDEPICPLCRPRFERTPRGGMPRWLMDAYASDRSGEL